MSINARYLRYSVAATERLAEKLKVEAFLEAIAQKHLGQPLKGQLKEALEAAYYRGVADGRNP